jgi:acetyl esterase/lipase
VQYSSAPCYLQPTFIEYASNPPTRRLKLSPLLLALEHAFEYDYSWSSSHAYCNTDVYLTCKSLPCPASPALTCSLFQYVNRKPLHQKPTAHISYHEGLRLIRSFLDYASHHTVEDVQAFTSQWVPHPVWVKVDQISIPSEIITKAANTLVHQLGPKGVRQVGGSKWWQWRCEDSELKAEWIEMRGDYNERQGQKGRRVMLYVHGGAYFFGSVDEHRYQMQRHARKLRAQVFAPRYRLAPQFPFPCGLHDCLAAYLYLLTMQEPEEIILAGDSAGGGMIVSMLVTLRDQGLPLPAGAVLISPWVDLTHSFPSVAGESDLDYIPPHGFMQKPSTSWPPPNDDERKEIIQGNLAVDREPSESAPKGSKSSEAEAVPEFALRCEVENDAKSLDESARVSEKHSPTPSTAPDIFHNLSIEIDGKTVVLKDQTQLYATNQLISHPLVSPVLQPSLGGLPPLLILTGGGEILRDEQIYLAHKAANPGKYPLGDSYQAEYDPNNEVLNKYKPTNVQLQVWDDLCHVAPTLSFTRPASFMYRSIAQFSAWALARAQHRSIDITDDDVSIISSESDTDTDSSADRDKQSTQTGTDLARVGKAGDPLPAFKNHMIRQRVNRHGVIHPMAPESDIPALQMPASDVGVIKPGPTRKWLAAKKEWDARYASEKRRVQKSRIREMREGGYESFGDGEIPSPSALAGRRQKGELGQREKKKKQKKSWGMTLWSLWGSEHDASIIKREEDMLVDDDDESSTHLESIDHTPTPTTNKSPLLLPLQQQDHHPKSPRPRTTSTASKRPRARRKSTVRSYHSVAATTTSSFGAADGMISNKPRVRRRTGTVSVADRGQIEGGFGGGDGDVGDAGAGFADESRLSPRSGNVMNTNDADVSAMDAAAGPANELNRAS